MDASEIKEALIACFPPGVEEVVDWNDAPGLHIEAIAQTVKVHAVDVIDGLAVDVTPLTCRAERLRDWERALGLAATRTARFGTLAQRRAQVISRLREYGATTLAMIRAVVPPLLAYPVPSQLVILEPDRDDLREKHTYSWSGSGAFGLVGFTFQIHVPDDAMVSDSGAQLDLTLTHSDLSTVGVIVYGPGGTAQRGPNAGVIGRGAASGTTIRIYLPELAGTAVGGAAGANWSIYLVDLGLSGTVTAASLFVEGFGRDRTRGDGLSAAAFGWAAVYEPSKAGAGADLDAARAAIARISYATRPGALVFPADASVGLAADDYGGIPNDNTVPGGFVPGAA